MVTLFDLGVKLTAPLGLIVTRRCMAFQWYHICVWGGAFRFL